MSNTYDWIVVGSGITGAALAYELVKQGLSVLLLEKNSTPNNATCYSYGGLAYWSGTSPLTRQLCQEGIEYHRNLTTQLEADTEFRELDLLLTINAEVEPQIVADSYSRFAIVPRLLSASQACELEPLLNRETISGVLQLPHGHINPGKTTQAYLQAYQRRGGKLQIAQVLNLLEVGNMIAGVKTTQGNIFAANTVICAGGLSRALLQEAGINVRLYFTHAEVIKTPPVALKLRTLVMPAQLQRFALEAKASVPEVDSLWDVPGNEPVPPILDPGAIQFLDGSLCLGQLSRVLTDPTATIDRKASEQKIRDAVGKILPTVANLPGTCHQCLVAFSNNSLPVVGKINGQLGLYLFSGFSNTLLFAPPLAQHFAQWAVTGKDEMISTLSVG